MNKQKIIIGIQGGKGSFNEAALQMHLTKEKIDGAEIAYLYTTENVLKALTEATIDQGQFAIYNTLGGIVDESIHAMGKYSFAVVDNYKIPIAHALMIRKDAPLADVDTIMTHPQVLAQCKHTLKKKYPQLKHVVGEGDLIDPAFVAEQLAQKKLPKNVAVMSTKMLAEIYGLTVVEDELQDNKENFTSFLLVKKN